MDTDNNVKNAWDGVGTIWRRASKEQNGWTCNPSRPVLVLYKIRLSFFWFINDGEIDLMLTAVLLSTTWKNLHKNEVITWREAEPRGRETA